MCGFAGFVEPDPTRAAAAPELLRAMAGTLEHRGPDDEGFLSDPDVGLHLGFRRLSIQDLSAAGHQPMASPSGRFAIVFNDRAGVPRLHLSRGE